MAVQYNPGIVTDGLVLCLDAANRKSYLTTGITWIDASFSGNNGTLINGPTFSIENNGVISFDGTDDYVKLPDGIFGVDNNAFTISIWFKTSSGGVLLSTASDSNISGNAIPGIYVDINGKLRCACFYDGVGNIAQTSTPSVNNGLWTNVTVTAAPAFAGSIVHTSYLNGISIGSSTRSQTGVATTTNYFFGGGRFFGFAMPDWPASNFLNCQIGHALLHRSTLSASQVLQNFNALRGRFGI